MSPGGRAPEKVIVVSYLYWPALNARAFRWTALAESWAREGCEVHVVCARTPGRPPFESVNGVQVHRVGSASIERLRASTTPEPGPRAAPRGGRIRRTAMAAVRSVWHAIYWPDTSCLWFFAARKKAVELIAALDPDALVSVSPTFTAVAVGRSVARRGPRRLRWLIDLGDPFSFADEAPQNNFRLYRELNIRFERGCFVEADAVSVTTPETRDRYAALFHESARKIAVIPPLVALPDTVAEPAQRPERRRLVFLGRLYPSIRRPDFLLALFAALVDSGAVERCELHFYGDTWECEASFAPYRHRLGRDIHLHGPVPREQAVSAMRSADVLVNIGNDTPYHLPSKIVEYAITGKPILNLAAHADDSSARFLAGYPSQLTLVARAEGPTRDQVENLRAFLGRPSTRMAPETLRAWLAPYALAEISARYRALLSGRPDER